MDNIDIQVACAEPPPFSEIQLKNWVMNALHAHNEESEITLRLVDLAEIQELNKTYRQKDKPTNVLAFPSQLPKAIQLEFPLLGDVIVCPAVLEIESLEQGVSLQAHWAHIVTHGVLHLLGYDHIEDNDTEKMQTMEINLLANLGFENPYLNEVGCE